MTRVLQCFAFLCKSGFCYLNLTAAITFKIEKKDQKNSGRSSKMTPSCRWPIFNSHNNLQFSAFFALRLSCVDLMTYLTIDWKLGTSEKSDFRLITTSENNFSEMTYPGQRPKNPSISLFSLLRNVVLTWDRKTDIDIYYNCPNENKNEIKQVKKKQKKKKQRNNQTNKN